MPDIIITPNRGTTSNPKIDFTGTTTGTIKLEVLADGTISWAGANGSLFSIADSMTGSLMSVNDASGLPILEVFDTDKVVMGQYNQNTLVVNGTKVGIGTASPTDKLTIANANSTGITFTGANATITATGNLIGVAGTNIYLRPGSGYSVNIDSGSGLTVTTNAYAGRYYDYNNTAYYADPDSSSVLNSASFAGSIKRADHAAGFLEGSYNNVGSNDAKSNPIYTIGSNYNPTNTALSNMYGIGYSHSNFYGGSYGWGMYVSAAGSIRAVLGGETGSYTSYSFRSPIFYDSDNTGYYTDPGSNSNLNTASVNYVSIGNTLQTQRLHFTAGSFIGLPIAYNYVPSGWQRGGSGIIIAGAQNSDGSGWSYGGRIISIDEGDGINIAFDSNYTNSWTNNSLVISGRAGKIGNIGIGTNAPVGKLHVKDTSATAGWQDFVVTPTTQWGDGSNLYMTLGAGGANGIMLSNPHIVWYGNNSAATIRMGRSGGVSSGAWYEVAVGSSDTFYINKNGPGNTFYINSSGNIGLGTSSPGYKLHVNGNSASTIMYDADNTNYYVDPSSLSYLKNVSLDSGYGTSLSSTGQLILGNTGNNYLFTQGSWSSSITAGMLANCSDNWEFAIHDSGQRVVSPFAFFGGSASNVIKIGRDIGWGVTAVEIPGSLTVSGKIVGVKNAINTVNGNLGSPTVEEMALIHGEFNNKLRFVAPYLQEESTNGSTWTTSTRASSQQLADFMIGEGTGTSIAAIPAPTVGGSGYYRLTWNVRDNVGYCYLNSLYLYCNTQGNNVTFTIEAKDNSSGSWINVTSGTVGNWPGHVYIPHSTLPAGPGGTNAGYYDFVRVTFAITNATYANICYLNNCEWWGGYPTGRRNVQWYDSSKNVWWPAKVYATQFVDSDNTGYYVDPASTSNLNAVTHNADAKFEIEAGVGGNGYLKFYSATNSNALVGYIFRSGSRMHIQSYNAASGGIMGNGLALHTGSGTNYALSINTNGDVSALTSSKAPVFYDSDDTAYFIDPNSSTVGGKIKYNFCVNGGASNSGRGLALWDSYSSDVPVYGITFAQTASLGTHGNVSGDYATYFTMNGTANRGWIFKVVGGAGVASIDNVGSATFASLGVGTAASGTSGEIRATNNVTAYYSDERLKTKLGPIENPIEKVKSLSGFYFAPNDTAMALGYKKTVDVGVSAQEVNAILPEIIAPAPIDPQYMTVRYEKLIPLLIEAIKAQQAQIEELRALLTNK